MATNRSTPSDQASSEVATIARLMANACHQEAVRNEVPIYNVRGTCIYPCIRFPYLATCGNMPVEKKRVNCNEKNQSARGPSGLRS